MVLKKTNSETNKHISPKTTSNGCVLYKCPYCLNECRLSLTSVLDEFKMISEMAILSYHLKTTFICPTDIKADSHKAHGTQRDNLIGLKFAEC